MWNGNGVKFSFDSVLPVCMEFLNPFVFYCRRILLISINFLQNRLKFEFQIKFFFKFPKLNERTKSFNGIRAKEEEKSP